MLEVAPHVETSSRRDPSLAVSEINSGDNLALEATLIVSSQHVDVAERRSPEVSFAVLDDPSSSNHNASSTANRGKGHHG